MTAISRPRRATDWLLRPFNRVAGVQALVGGIAVLALTAWIASASGLMTDGVLDLHFTGELPFWVVMAQGLINWLCLSLALMLVGWWLGRGGFRPVDLFGTQALARWPLLIATAYLALPGLNQTVRDLTNELMTKMPTDPSKVMASSAYLLDAMWLFLISLPTLLCLIWMIWLMFHGFAVSTGMKGARAGFSFAGALLIAWIASKVLIFYALPGA
jgi:hypothetical protein